jgi:threonine synthase
VTETLTIQRASSAIAKSADVFWALAHLNPPRTHKFYAARRAVAAAVAGEYRAVTAGTCGNYGRAVAHCCKLVGLACHLFVPASYEVAASGEGHGENYPGASITAVGETYEDAVEASIAHARSGDRVFDANPTPVSGDGGLEGYRQLAELILERMPARPTHVWVPTGNGTTLVGLFEGFERRNCRPAMIAVGSTGNTAATASVRAGQAIDLDPAALRVTHVNEPLINWHSYHAQEAVHAVRHSGGWACDLTDAALLDAVKYAAGDGVHCTPSGGAAVSAFLQWRAGNEVQGQTHVLLVTA